MTWVVNPLDQEIDEAAVSFAIHGVCQHRYCYTRSSNRSVRIISDSGTTAPEVLSTC